MAGVRQDNIRVKLDIEASQARTELDNLQRKSRLLADQLKECRKGTQEYVDTNKQLKAVTKDMEEVRAKLGLAGLSYNQLDTLSKQLNRELRKLGPGTQEFIDKSAELQKVDAQLTKVKNESDIAKYAAFFGVREQDLRNYEFTPAATVYELLDLLPNVTSTYIIAKTKMSHPNGKR